VHEYSIASSILDTALAHARRRDARRVVGLELRIGELSGVEVPLLEKAWSLVRERSACEGVDLTVRTVAAVFRCRDCGLAVDRGAVLTCQRCGGRARMEAGDELVLDRIEMEVA
jgi:hydrogenase nickel incorporation protein HypA/HybF